MESEKKLKFIDLFAGAGGFSLGFEMAGMELILAIEKDDWAVETLQANHDPRKIFHADITKIENICEIIKDKPDIIIGGPPCQGFSSAGPNKDPNDPRNSLFVFFSKWVDVLRPKVFVMENVTGILSRKNSNGDQIASIIVNTFEKIGYHVDIWKLQAADYGVPQNRKRVFFVGNLLGIKLNPPDPSHYILNGSVTSSLKPAVTVGEAILDLPLIYAQEGSEKQFYDKEADNEYQKWARQNSEFVFNHISMAHTKRLVERFRLIQSGINIEEVPHHYKVRKRNGKGELSNNKFNLNYRHLKPEKISNTIPASFYSSFIHPLVPRNLTSREAARLQSFPDCYVFKGKRTLISKKLLLKSGKPYFDRLSQYNQIGNAVPPLLAKAIGNYLVTYFRNF